MRFVYSNVRLETAEGVVELLRENGIETIMRNGRGYKGTRRSNFSYRREYEAVPEVWVVNNDDQVRARQILRDAQLIDTTRDRHSYLVELDERANKTKSSQRKGMWIRMAILGGLLLIMAFVGVQKYMASKAPPQPLAGPFDGKSRTIPAPVAVVGLQKGIDQAVMPALCLSFDGQIAPQDLLQRLQGNGKKILAKNHCTRNDDPDFGTRSSNGELAELIDVTNFKAKSPTTGTIDVNTYHHSQWAHYRTFEVQLVNGKWVVGKMTRHVAS